MSNTHYYVDVDRIITNPQLGQIDNLEGGLTGTITNIQDPNGNSTMRVTGELHQIQAWLEVEGYDLDAHKIVKR